MIFMPPSVRKAGRHESWRKAASDLGRDLTPTNEGLPAAPVLPVGSVVTILTPPGPCRLDRPARIFDAIVTNPMSCKGLASQLFNVNRLANRPETGQNGPEHAGLDGQPGRAESADCRV